MTLIPPVSSAVAPRFGAVRIVSSTTTGNPYARIHAEKCLEKLQKRHPEAAMAQEQINGTTYWAIAYDDSPWKGFDHSKVSREYDPVKETGSLDGRILTSAHHLLDAILHANSRDIIPVNKLGLDDFNLEAVCLKIIENTVHKGLRTTPAQKIKAFNSNRW